MTRFTLNTMTAKPLLELLLAQAGMEHEQFPPERAWPVFAEFARLPSASGDDVVSFQAMPGDEHGLADAMVILWSRQLADAAPGYDAIRSVVLQYVVEDLGVRELDPVEAWSGDFNELGEFLAHVEALPHFELLRRVAPASVSLYLEEHALPEE